MDGRRAPAIGGTGAGGGLRETRNGIPLSLQPWERLWAVGQYTKPRDWRQHIEVCNVEVKAEHCPPTTQPRGPIPCRSAVIRSPAITKGKVQQRTAALMRSPSQCPAVPLGTVPMLRHQLWAPHQLHHPQHRAGLQPGRTGVPWTSEEMNTSWSRGLPICRKAVCQAAAWGSAVAMCMHPGLALHLGVLCAVPPPHAVTLVTAHTCTARASSIPPHHIPGSTVSPHAPVCT